MQQVPVDCFVCGGQRERELIKVVRRANDGSEGTYRLAVCDACRFVFVSPRPTAEELFALYSRHEIYFREGYEPISRELPALRLVLQDIRRYVRSGLLLEIGCGRGELCELALKQGFQVWGCDLQRPPTLDSGVNFHLGTLDSAGFADESFDCIVMRNTLEHLFDPRDNLNVCQRLLKKGGYLYLKVPNADYEHGWRCRIIRMRPNVFGPPWHLNHFTPVTLRKFLESQGFAVKEWLIEQPTTVPDRWKDRFQKALVAGFRAARALSFGSVFPRPLLSCMTQKVAH
jgi:SAM-dependent methyltransferase